jgi:hypothetical protein
MANLVSPGVQVKEIDLTNVVPSVSSTIGAMAGAFAWGPVNEVVTVSSETQLVEKFGKSDANTFESVLTASQFLSYGNNLKVVRAVGSAARNATASGTGILTQNKAVFDGQTPAAADWAQARYPGVTGNAVGVSVLTATQTGTAWQLSNVEGAPGTSAGAAAVGGSNDEIHIWVYDVNGSITGTAGTVLETWTYLSQASDVKSSDGTSLYYKDVINSGSNWVFIGNHAAALTDAGDSAVSNAFTNVATFFIALTGGIDANTLTVGETTTALAYFADAETIDVNLVFQSNSSLSSGDTITLSNYITALTAARKDAVGFVSPERTATVNVTAAAALTAVAAWRTGSTSTSYGFADSSSLYVYDKYNDVYRWIAAAGSTAGLTANADLVADAWFSPAGFTRGNVRNVTKLAWNPNQASRDALYKTGVNPIVTFPGQGTVLFGDKTLQSKPSAFDRINVRRLFIVLEKAVSTASKFRNMVEPFLRDVKGRRGITDFKVVCDGTNNTGNIIDTNKFVADIYVKPARSINYITLNFIATRTGVEFSEIAGGN